jgi:hypothetical protein
MFRAVQDRDHLDRLGGDPIADDITFDSEGPDTPAKSRFARACVGIVGQEPKDIV